MSDKAMTQTTPVSTVDSTAAKNSAMGCFPQPAEIVFVPPMHPETVLTLCGLLMKSVRSLTTGDLAMAQNTVSLVNGVLTEHVELARPKEVA